VLWYYERISQLDEVAFRWVEKNEHVQKATCTQARNRLRSIWKVDVIWTI